MLEGWGGQAVFEQVSGSSTIDATQQGAFPAVGNDAMKVKKG